MTNNEVNKVIAEYMDYSFYRDDKDLGYIYVSKNGYMYPLNEFLYTLSLDLLIPVWKRIGLQDVRLFWHKDGHSAGVHNSDVSGFDLTIQEAAAHATAKAILALGVIENE